LTIVPAGGAAAFCGGAAPRSPHAATSKHTIAAAAQAARTGLLSRFIVILLRVAKFELVLISRRSLRRVAALQPHRPQLSSERVTVTAAWIQESLAL
jgi:hypothetical protein